jgi:hypothetical protein
MEHFLEHREDAFHRRIGEPAEYPGNTGPINRAQLIRHHLAGLSLETADDSGRIETTLRGHRRDHNRAEVIVEFVG